MPLTPQAYPVLAISAPVSPGTRVYSPWGYSSCATFAERVASRAFLQGEHCFGMEFCTMCGHMSHDVQEAR